MLRMILSRVICMEKMSVGFLFLVEILLLAELLIMEYQMMHKEIFRDTLGEKMLAGLILVH